MLSWPFRINSLLLSEYLLHPAVNVVDVQEVTDDSGPVLIVDFDVVDRMAVSNDGIPLSIRGARVKLDRSRGLLPVDVLIRGVSSTREENEFVIRPIEFVEQNGLTVPIKTTRELIQGSERFVQSEGATSTADFTAELPYHEFVLSAFGLSEPGTGPLRGPLA